MWGATKYYFQDRDGNRSTIYFNAYFALELILGMNYFFKKMI